MKIALENPVFKIIADTAEEIGTLAFVVGGYVRDQLLGRPSQDIDIVTIGNGIELAERTALKMKGRPKVNVFKNYGTAMFRFNNTEFEFVGARKESYSRHSRKPFVESGTLKDDQNRRDFTINALAASLQKEDYGVLVDPFDGVEDLRNKIIRTPTDPLITFSDDPLRMIRAVRFATQLDFTIYPETFSAIQKNAHRLEIVSRERITDELNKILLAQKPGRGFLLLDKSGLLERFFPELAALKGVEIKNGIAHKDNFIHTLKVLDNVARHSDNLWLRWAALLHDIAKPLTKKFDPKAGWTFHAHDFIGSKMIPKIFKRLRLPLNDKMKYVQKLVQLHLRPIALTEEIVTDSAVRRLLIEAGDDIDDLMALCKADITSKNLKKVKTFLTNFEHVEKKLVEIEEKDKLRNWEPPISGEIIMKAFDIPPGRKVGEIKKAIREAILDGKIENDFDAAYSFMLEKGQKLGLASDINEKE